MDPILSEVYSTVLPAAPYVLAAYVGILLTLFAFVFSLWRKSKRTEAPYVLAAYVGILLTLFAFVFSLWRKSKRTEADIDALKRALDDRERSAGK